MGIMGLDCEKKGHWGRKEKEENCGHFNETLEQ